MYKKVIFNCSLFFQLFLLVRKLYKLGLEITQHVSNMIKNLVSNKWFIEYISYFELLHIRKQCLYYRIFSIIPYKTLLSSFGHFLATFSWSVSCLSLVFKLCSILWTFQKLKHFLYLDHFGTVIYENFNLNY